MQHCAQNHEGRMRVVTTVIPPKKLVELMARAMCDKCNSGELIAVPNVTLTYDPPLYPHRCNKCDNAENLRAPYPHSEYQEYSSRPKSKARRHK